MTRSNPLTGLAVPTILAALIGGSFYIFVGVIAAVLTAYLLNRFRLPRIFAFPPLVFLALAVVYTCLIGSFVIPS